MAFDLFIRPQMLYIMLKYPGQVYEFKPSLAPDMQDADLIISHAGAGCIMESLRHAPCLCIHELILLCCRVPDTRTHTHTHTHTNKLTYTHTGWGRD
jgi:UDP-N-acetylglucosamine transferase subunit ALG13